MIWSCARGDPRSRGDRAYARMAVSFDRHPRRRSLCRRPVLAGGHPYVDAQAVKGLSMLDAGVAAREGKPR